MKLIIRADDFGLTDGVTWGIKRGFDEGIITSTGLMTNMPSSKAAADLTKSHPHWCVGQDINIATGKCVGEISKLKTMVDENGYFRRSNIIRPLIKQGIEPFPYDEIIYEVRSQVNKFIELVGHKPAYLNGHAFRSENFTKALQQVAEEMNILCMDSLVDKYDLEAQGFEGTKKFAAMWYPSDMSAEGQLSCDGESYFVQHYDELLKRDVAYLICHPGYIDGDLMRCSSMNLLRFKDLEMCISEKVKTILKENDVELISIIDFAKMKGEI